MSEKEERCCIVCNATIEEPEDMCSECLDDEC